MAHSIPNRIIMLRELTKEYYPLPSGALISKPKELLRVIDIKSTKHTKHPHETFRVYITRRALKHIVEQRSSELSKAHNEAEILLKVCFAIEQIPEIINSFDKYEYEHSPEKYFYTKHYPGNPSIRILCEPSKSRDNSLEICSIHFKRQKKEEK